MCSVMEYVCMFQVFILFIVTKILANMIFLLLLNIYFFKN